MDDNVCVQSDVI